MSKEDDERKQLTEALQEVTAWCVYIAQLERQIRVTKIKIRERLCRLSKGNSIDFDEIEGIFENMKELVGVEIDFTESIDCQ